MDNNITQKPVVFLTFANDRIDGAAYLRDLPKERREIWDVLDRASKDGLCEVVVKPDVTIKDIFDVFRDDHYRNRIAIFHYAGHANCYQLLLNSIEGGLAAAYKEGLASFLGRQNGLKLIFLNGCSSEQHALELIREGIPAVVGTSQAIADDVATKLSMQFYEGIARGFSVDRAWLDAEDYIKTEQGTHDFRNFYHQGKQESEDCFPWNIFYKPGGESVRDWNLPDAAHDPLFGLPEIPESYGLPESPFLYLRRYEREHAKVFFGRSYYIRDLYNRITDPKSPGIILLHGQSGVGKSSLLEAGLLPRLEGSHSIIYARRKKEIGLAGTFEEAMQNYPLVKEESQAADNLTVVGKWRFLESKAGKPLVVILDQAEEMYTRPNEELSAEFVDFLEIVKKIFNDRRFFPEGKLILCYRKEYNPEIDKEFSRYELPRSWMFVEPLSRRDIMEVVTGLTGAAELKQRYRNIEVEENLPVIIADDLLADRQSPVAPLLQIIMTRMWNGSLEQGNIDARFTPDAYQKLRKDGIAMKSFFDQQISRLRNWNEEIVDKGLVLDILHFHTNELGTSCSRDIEEIRQTYSHKGEMVDSLVQKLKQLYLLTDTRNKVGDTSLAHDTLAPTILKECNESRKPVQRAERILSGKIEDFKRDEKICLDEEDLKIVERAEGWMRVLDDDEKVLLRKSQVKREKREKAKKRRLIAAAVLVALIFAAAITAAIMWKIAEARKEIAEENYKKAEANRLIYCAKEEEVDDPTQALRIAEKAYQLNQEQDILEKVHEIYRENVFHRIVSKQEKRILCVSFSADGSHILAGLEDGTIHSWDFQGEKWIEFKRIEQQKKEIRSCTFSPDCRYILTGYEKGDIRLEDVQGKELLFFHKKEREPGITHTLSLVCSVFSPDGRYILTGSADTTARLWDKQGRRIKIFEGHRSEITSVAFSPDGNYILTGSMDNTACLWDLAGGIITAFEGHRGCINSIAFSPDGNNMLTGSADNTARLWNKMGEIETIFEGHKKEVTCTVFSPDGVYILTASKDNTARLWNKQGKEIQVFKGHESPVTCAIFSKSGRFILTAADDNTIRLWDIKGITCKVLLNHRELSAVNSVAFSPDDRYILTGSDDKTARLWSFEGKIKKSFNEHGDKVRSVNFSPGGKFFVTGSWDGKVRLWDVNQDNDSLYWDGKARLLDVYQDNGVKSPDVYSTAVSSDGKYFIFGSYSGYAYKWDFERNTPRSFSCHEEGITSVAISSDSKYFLTGSYDKTARLWDIEGNPVKTLSGHEQVVTSVAFSPDGKHILTGSHDKTARLWDVDGSLLQILSGHEQVVSSVAFSPDGRYILTGSKDNTARLWDIGGYTVQVFSGHDKSVTSVAFSPGGTYILTGSKDKTARIWVARTQLEKFLNDGICEKLSEEQKKI